MCGIIGGAGWLGETERRAVKNMLVMDTLRGEHSTGIATLSPDAKKNHIRVVKLAVNALDFLKWGPAKTELNMTSSMIIGHNRYATIGAVNNINAHPFEFDGVVGVHNGTLRSRVGLLDSKLFEVDSENLYYTLDKEDMTTLYPKLDGALGLVYFDKREGTVNLVRNKERPLFYTFTRDRKTLFWASEGWMLTGTLGRNRIEHTEVVECKEHVLYSFVVPKAYVASQAVPFDDITTTQLAPFKPKVVEYPPFKGSKEPRPKKNCSAPSKQHGAGIVKYSGKEVEFFTEGLEVRQGKAYMSCSLLNDESVEVRVYGTMKDKIMKEMDGSTTVFSGVVKHVSAFGVEPYLEVGISTVKETDLDLIEMDMDDNEARAYLGRDGLLLTEAEANDALAGGCAWCDQMECVDSIADVSWFGQSDQYICSDCSTNPEVRQYLAY